MIPKPILLGSFLEQLPLVRSRQGAVFAHSLPFEKELGLSAMARVMKSLAANHFFRMFPNEVLFRGHSHTPEIICSRDGRTATRSIPIDETISLADLRRCVITCGGLMDGPLPGAGAGRRMDPFALLPGLIGLCYSLLIFR